MLFYFRVLLSYITMFFKKGELSDKDIRKLMGKQIYIYPFKEKNLKGGSYNLTASKCALVIDKEDKRQKLITHGDEIIIPAGMTGIVETNECIYVSRWITGTYHSKVKLANKGIGHIGTTLDPDFFGVSAIALHNLTDKPITIKHNESIATIIFSTVRSFSSGNNDNMSGHFNDLHYDTDQFYDFKKGEKDFQVVSVKYKDSNDKENEFNINLKDIECEYCMTCNKKDDCGYKLLKCIRKEVMMKEKDREDIKKWRNQEWILDKRSLKKIVRKEMIIRDTFKDNIRWGVIVILGFILAFILLNIFEKNILNITNITKNSLDKIKENFIIGSPTAIAVIIGWIATYKNNVKNEYEKNN